MNPIYTVKFYKQFSIEFQNYPLCQQDKILDFVETFEQHGLSDFSKYNGKISQSWATLQEEDINYHYAKNNNLWHYHIGIPHYKQLHQKYKTSDVVLHFQWHNQGSTVYLVDIYDHYKVDGSFYLPPPEYLAR
jgi:mRNA-degrading endonuclease RelE of RelBE toxin-antitoxin system